MPTLRTLLRVSALLSLSFALVGTAHAKKKKKNKPVLPWTAVSPKEGKSVLDVLAEANLSKDSSFKPFAIAPDYRYGLTKEFSLGVTHSGYARTGFYGGAGSGGLCLSGEDGGCPSIYSGLGAEVGLKIPIDGPTNLGGTLGFQTTGLGSDFGQSHMKIGAKGRYLKKPVVFWYQPNFLIGMEEGARHLLNVPAAIGMLSGNGFIPFVQSGVVLELSSGAGDDPFAIPLTVGGTYKTDKTMWVGGTFTVRNIAAQSSGPLDNRALNANFGMMF